jgi:hypothetical protein
MVKLLRASFLVPIFLFFSLGLAKGCDPNEKCNTCLASAFGQCVVQGNDPTCEARKLACAGANTQRTAAGPASQAASGIGPQTPTLQDEFLKYDYAETKDLSKSFLTLVAAILVFSLTFSDKIVDFPHAGQISRASLVTSWSLLMFSIILCGVALCFISIAGGSAVYGGDYLSVAVWAWLCLLGAGSLFAIGLVALIVAATASLSKRPPEHIDG